jgi:hypothetical protein
MVQIIPQGDIFGRIGEGVGEGISKQLPQEMDRMRLSKGLSEMEQGGQNLSPVQLAARMMAIPGMRPEYLTALYPMMQAEMNRRARMESLKPVPGEETVPGEQVPQAATQGSGIGAAATAIPQQEVVQDVDRAKTLSTKYGLPTKVFKSAREQQAMMKPEPRYTPEKQLYYESLAMKSAFLPNKQKHKQSICGNRENSNHGVLMSTQPKHTKKCSMLEKRI